MIDPAWLVAAMLFLEPSSPFVESFPRTASAIAVESERSPLPGMSPDRTASVLLSLAWFESRFQIDAAGDCERSTELGTCAKDAKHPRSFGLFQIGGDNLRAAHVTVESATSDPDIATRVALSMLRRSFQICRSRPLLERASWYAGGGTSCPTGDASTKSVHRLAKAAWIYDRFRGAPLPDVVVPLDAALDGAALARANAP